MQIYKTDFKGLFIFIDIATAPAHASAELYKKTKFVLLICLVPFLVTKGLITRHSCFGKYVHAQRAVEIKPKDQGFRRKWRMKHKYQELCLTTSKQHPNKEGGKGIFVTRDRPFFFLVKCEMTNFSPVNHDFHSSREA